MNTKESIKNSIKFLLFFTLLTGVLYPIFIFLAGQALFNGKANGSMVKVNNKIIGSALIGQKFTGSKYFQPRPSAIDYNPLPSGGRNLSLTSKALVQQYNDSKAAFVKDNLLNNNAQVPEEMLFASASGIDPDITKESAIMQVNRICKARNFSEEKKNNVYALINSTAKERQFGFLGEETINVLLLNIKLDELNK